MPYQFAKTANANFSNCVYRVINCSVVGLGRNVNTTLFDGGNMNVLIANTILAPSNITKRQMGADKTFIPYSQSGTTLTVAKAYLMWK